jgi:hypothetical protein
MPIMSFKCQAGHQFDELFLGTETVPDVLACNCGKLAERRTVYRTSVIGPVFEHLESYENILFTSAQRKEGARIKSYKDLNRVEAEQGIYREDDSFYRVARQEQMHEAHLIQKAHEAGGREGALDFVEDMHMKEKTGWNDQQLNTWKEQVNAVEASVPEPTAIPGS